MGDSRDETSKSLTSPASKRAPDASATSIPRTISSPTAPEFNNTSNNFVHISICQYLFSRAARQILGLLIFPSLDHSLGTASPNTLSPNLPAPVLRPDPIPSA